MFQSILDQYMNEQIISIEKLNTSENSFNYKLTTENSVYILRRLKSKYQGEIEWDLSELLDEEDILPKILSTIDYKKYVGCEGNYYNLQEYFQNEEIKLSNADFYKLGQLLAKIHEKTQIYHSEVWNTNAFDLNEMLKKLKDKVFYEEIAKYNLEFLKRIDNAKTYELIKEDVIHGDMTLHNVLYNEGKFRIIDLGEVRLGSRYFDLAGLIYSLKQKGPDNKEKHIDQAISGYESIYGKIDYRMLQNMLELWGMRGIVQLLLNQKKENINSEFLSKMIEIHDEICAFTNERIDANINI